MLADFTAGRELHPALKNAIYFYRSMLDPSYSIVKKIFELFNFLLFEKVKSALVWILLILNTMINSLDFTDYMF